MAVLLEFRVKSINRVNLFFAKNASLFTWFMYIREFGEHEINRTKLSEYYQSTALWTNKWKFWVEF